MNYPQKSSRLACGALTLILLGGCACYKEEPAPAPAPAPVAQAPAPAPEPTTEAFTLNSEQLFDFDKSTLHAEGETALKAAIARHLGDSTVTSVSVVGHTDSVGSDEYNQALSERRANTVRDFLIENGIDASKITTTGRGESSPAASNDTAEGRQKNRRVEVTAELVRTTAD